MLNVLLKSCEAILAARARKTAVEFRVIFAQMWRRAIKFLFPFVNIGMYLLLVGKVKSNCRAHLHQG